MKLLLEALFSLPGKVMANNTYYLTTPIYYVNSNPHLGHAYTSILADTACRFHAMLGEKPLLLSGTDEHGDKIVKAAEAKNASPEKFVDEISASFENLLPSLSVNVNFFNRTTSRRHVEVVREFLQKIYEAGDIYFGEFGGYYCYGCERFYTEKELENGLCPQHLVKPDFISEKNYFFRMSKYLPWLKKYIEDNPELIRPERYRREALAMLEGGVLEDLCISRPKTRLTWGIELPFDPDYVCYVWFDALLSYIGGIGWPDRDEFKTFWPGEHLIAKDILKPHAIFWPCMLKAANIPVYRHLNVHGYWLSRNTKMSKSLGNVIDPLATAERFGLDAFRYFLLRDMRFGADASFSEENMAGRINSDLANDIGNLFSRVLSMNSRYFGAKTPPPWRLLPDDHAVISQCGHMMANLVQLWRHMEFALGLECLLEFARHLNKYVDTQAPWSLYKVGDKERLATVLGVLLASMRKIALCLWPAMPDAASAMLNQLGERDATPDRAPTFTLEAEAESFQPLLATVRLAESSNIFPRLEIPAKEAMPAEKMARKIVEKPKAGLDEFKALGLTAGRILKAEKHPDADRILILEIDFGAEAPRQILSGLAEHYRPEELAGKMVCAILNLPPRKIRGLVSNGMVLTTESGGKLFLLDPGPVQPGTPIA